MTIYLYLYLFSAILFIFMCSNPKKLSPTQYQSTEQHTHTPTTIVPDIHHAVLAIWKTTSCGGFGRGFGRVDGAHQVDSDDDSYEVKVTSTTTWHRAQLGGHAIALDQPSLPRASPLESFLKRWRPHTPGSVRTLPYRRPWSGHSPPRASGERLLATASATLSSASTPSPVPICRPAFRETTNSRPRQT